MKRPTSTHAAAVIVGAMGLAPASARADDPPPLALAWSAPSTCPTRDAMVDRVGHLLGPDSHASTKVEARAVVAPNDSGGFHGEVTIALPGGEGGEPSTRAVDGDTCEAVADALALIVTLAIDPSASATLPPPAPRAPRKTPPTQASPSPERASAPPPPPPPAPTSKRRPFFVSASLLLDSATLPSIALGAEGSVGWNPRHVALEIEGAWLPPNHATLPDKPLEGASEQLFYGGARGCYEIFDRALDVGPCAAFGLGVLPAEGFGSSTTTSTSPTIAFGSVAARAKLRLGERFALRLDAGVVVPFARPSFLIDNAGTVSRVSAASFRAGLGAELHF